jgi:hypothetical protein
VLLKFLLIELNEKLINIRIEGDLDGISN